MYRWLDCGRRGQPNNSRIEIAQGTSDKSVRMIILSKSSNRLTEKFVIAYPSNGQNTKRFFRQQNEPPKSHPLTE
ncbi:MAG: hypothetical protein ACI9TH_002781 [Kiritimatiellia bacterium]